MEPTADPFDYSTETLLRAKATECAELRELLAAVAGDLDRLARTCRTASSHARCGPGAGCGEAGS